MCASRPVMPSSESRDDLASVRKSTEIFVKRRATPELTLWLPPATP